MSRVAPQAAIEAELRGRPEFKRACFDVAEVVVHLAQRIALVENFGPGGGRFNHGIGPAGGLVSGIHAMETVRGARARSSVDWSAPNEGGWGEGGPEKRPIIIRPDAKPRRFKVYGRGGATLGLGGGGFGGRWVSTRLIKGHKGTHYMERAAVEACSISPSLTWHPHPWRNST